MNLYNLYDYFRGKGKIKSNQELYKHASRKEISEGLFLGYLCNKKGARLDSLEEDLQIDQNEIIDFMKSFNSYKGFERYMFDQGYYEMPC